MRKPDSNAGHWSASGGGEFQRFCGDVAAALGADARLVPRVAALLATLRRLPLVWFQFSPAGSGQDAFATCTNPWAGDLLFAQLPLGAASRDPALASGPWRNLAAALRACSGRYLCVIEGALPGVAAGAPGLGRMLHVAADVCSHARAVLLVGGEAARGALAAANAAGPSLTDALGLPAIQVPGCPPSSLAFAATLVAHLLARSAAAETAEEAPSAQVI